MYFAPTHFLFGAGRLSREADGTIFGCTYGTGLQPEWCHTGVKNDVLILIHVKYVIKIMFSYHILFLKAYSIKISTVSNSIFYVFNSIYY